LIRRNYQGDIIMPMLINVPTRIKHIIKEWIADFRAGPAHHPERPSDEMLSRYERLSRSSPGVSISIDLTTLGNLASVAYANANTSALHRLSGEYLAAALQIQSEGREVYKWCSEYLEIEVLGPSNSPALGFTFKKKTSGLDETHVI
jgi:hypothetical protein